MFHHFFVLLAFIFFQLPQFRVQVCPTKNEKTIQSLCNFVNWRNCSDRKKGLCIHDPVFTQVYVVYMCARVYVYFDLLGMNYKEAHARTTCNVCGFIVFTPWWYYSWFKNYALLHTVRIFCSDFCTPSVTRKNDNAR